MRWGERPACGPARRRHVRQEPAAAGSTLCFAVPAPPAPLGGKDGLDQVVVGDNAHHPLVGVDDRQRGQVVVGHEQGDREECGRGRPAATLRRWLAWPSRRIGLIEAGGAALNGEPRPGTAETGYWVHVQLRRVDETLIKGRSGPEGAGRA